MNPPKGDFVDYYLPPFAAAVERANPTSIMCSNFDIGLSPVSPRIHYALTL